MQSYHGDEKFTYIVLDPASVVCDVELWVRHAWLVVQRITTVVKVTLLQERLVPGLKEKPAQQKIIILSTVSSYKRHVRSKIEIAEFKPFPSHSQSLEMVFVQQALPNF